MKKHIIIFFFILSCCALNAQVWQQTNGPTAQTTYPTQAFATVGTIQFRGTAANGVLKSTDNMSNWTAVNTGITNLNIKAMCTIGTTILAGSSGAGIYISTNNGTNWNTTNTGLTNLTVRALLVTGGNIFAGTAGGVFLSADTGATWTAVNTGLTTLSVNALMVKTTSLFAGTQGGGIFLSTDNGTSWTAVNTGITNLNITSLAVNSQYYFAGTSSGVATVFRTSIFGAVSWSAVYTGTAVANVNTIVTNSNWIYIGCGSPIGLLFSSSDGVGCTPKNSGLGGTGFIQAVYALYRIGSSSTIFAGTSAGVFILDNTYPGTWYGANGNGAITVVTSLGYGNFGTGPAILAGNPSSGGIYGTHNNGTNWYNLYKYAYPNSKGLIGSNPYILSGEFGGVKVSSDNGGSWTYNNTGLTSTNVHCLYGGGGVYAGTNGGVFQTTNYTSWTQLPTTGLGDLDIMDLVQGSNNALLYSISYYGDICKYNLGTWTYLNSLGGYGTCLIRSSNGACCTDKLVAGTNNGIHYSNNNGTTWSLGSGTSSYSITSLVQVGTAFLAGTANGVLVSTDNAVTWSSFSTGLTGSGLIVNALRWESSSTVLAATNAGVWKIDLAPVAAPTVSTTTCTGSTVTLTCSAASSYLWSTGATTQSIIVSSSGSYSVTASNVFGFSAPAVSTIVSLAPLPVSAITPLGSASVCQGDSLTLSASSGGVNYYSYLWSTGETTQNINVSISGNYTVTTYNINGCSATSAPTIITVLPPSNPPPVSQAACDTYTWNGQTINASGTYTQLFTNVSGCDSTATINLSIQSNAETINPNACNSYILNGQTFTSNGTYYQVLSNIYGCDSTVTINLTINPAMDTTVTQAGNVFTANEAGATYQWLDCNNGYASVTGETSQSFSLSFNGNYAVMITTNTCGTDTSACYSFYSVGINDTESENNLTIYPNPLKDKLEITYFDKLSMTESGIKKVKIYTVLGVLVQSEAFLVNRNNVKIDLTGEAKGIYFLEVTLESFDKLRMTKVINKKIIKQ